MTDTKSKKLRIYKFASEVNLSAEQLLEFLQKKNHAVKTIQSILSDEMITDINNHFKKDIEKAEKHYKKVAELAKKRPEKEEKKPAAKEEAPVVPVKEEIEQEIQEFEEMVQPEIDKPIEVIPEEIFEVTVLDKKPEDIPIVVIPEDQPLELKSEVENLSEENVEVIKKEPLPEAIKEQMIEEVKEESQVRPVPEANPILEEVKSEVPVDTVSQELPIIEDKKSEEKAFISPKEAEAGKRKGLTILGKIDLSKPKKVFKKPEDRRRPEDRRPDVRKPEDKKDEKPKQEQPQDNRRPHEKRFYEKVTLSDLDENKRPSQASAPSSAASEAAKKKKKPKAKKKEATVEDIPVVKKKKKVKRFEIDQKEVKESIRKTLLSMEDSGSSERASSRKKKRREREIEEERRLEQKIADEKVIHVTEFIAVNELANLMNVSVGDVISKCIQMGIMVSINQRLDVDTITLVADEFGFQVEFQKEYTADALEDTPDEKETLLSRSPVVTIMGHVDHGKTSLLDYIRNTNVVAGESGGITQHIGAYRVNVGNNKYITFLDTPGHEAFTAMRARGAQLTDIVVLVVAADDAVMPQTIEAINHAQAANVPIVIAINKIDKPGVNLDRIKQQLGDRNILVEDWGGKYQSVELSAKTGKNVSLLLEKILLEADLLDLKANPSRAARGAVVESELDKGRGITATILVQKGTLKIGDPFVAGIHHGRVRAMFDERGNRVQEAPPSTPVLVVGFEGSPQAGDTFVVVENERTAREISIKRTQLKREQDQKQVHHVTLDEIAKQISIGGVKELPLIVKGDVDGSVEALSDSLMKLSNEEVIVRVIHKGVGGISESDVLLAAASNAIIIGFHVRPNLNARKLAETQKVDIRLYNIIYDVINEVKSALEGLLSPLLSEEVVASLEIRDTFKVPKFGTVAGCYVLEGKISRNAKVRLIRDGIVIHEGEIGSLKRFKDDVRDVDAGYECGLNLANYNDIKIGDILEAYKIIETKKKLV